MREIEIKVEMLKLRNMMDILGWKVISEKISNEGVLVEIWKATESVDMSGQDIPGEQ